MGSVGSDEYGAEEVSPLASPVERSGVGEGYERFETPEVSEARVEQIVRPWTTDLGESEREREWHEVDGRGRGFVEV